MSSLSYLCLFSDLNNSEMTDIYLQPLIDELQELWNGMYTYDASQKMFFNMKVMLLWTIIDFLVHENLTGCATKGKYACPLCGKNTYNY